MLSADVLRYPNEVGWYGLTRRKRVVVLLEFLVEEGSLSGCHGNQFLVRGAFQNS